MWAKGVTLSAGAFVFLEAELAKGSGLALRTFQRARVKHLRQSEEWSLREQHVVYTKNGVAKIMELVSGYAPDAMDLEKLEKLALFPGLTEEGLPAAAPKPVPPILAHVARFYPNPYLLGVELKSGDVVHLKVQSTKNFKKGMEVPVRKNLQGQWELARKLPRNFGRW